MQRYQILHRTYYNFSGVVTLEPHTLMLRPREDHELRIESLSLTITPSATLLWRRDVEGNSVALATFDTPTDQLLIESKAIVQQYNEDPLEFLVEDYAIHFPFSYSPDDRILLSPYLTLPDDRCRRQLDGWTEHFWKPGEAIQTYTILHRMAAYIFNTLSYRIREAPGLQTPAETLSFGSGSCRDFAALFMQSARCLGLASRFVSGYLYALPSTTDLGATHAWAEVYLPGAGWKGFDPTSGKIVGAEHIAVAVARLPEAVPPVAGSFVGPPGANLDVGVWVTKES